MDGIEAINICTGGKQLFGHLYGRREVKRCGPIYPDFMHAGRIFIQEMLDAFSIPQAGRRKNIHSRAPINQELRKRLMSGVLRLRAERQRHMQRSPARGA